ncbi:MAG: hypothetical protein JO271_09260 [Verrucomicrobia bacterium]|nr:hypothetical protein [Verrucomicrobiota bacterium]
MPNIFEEIEHDHHEHDHDGHHLPVVPEMNMGLVLAPVIFVIVLLNWKKLFPRKARN